MKSSVDLQNLLHRIDHKGYPAYKDTKGQYQFDRYVLSIDHVQGDPFAAPSKVSIWIAGRDAAFEKVLYDQPCKRIALQDYLLRRMAEKIGAYSFKARGSGKSGLIAVAQPGQEILNRSACAVNAENGDITVRMEIGFPANGRTINAGELEKILFDFLPVCVRQTLFRRAHRKEALEEVMHLAVDQQYIREELPRLGLAAFLANGAVLPRKSGVSQLPMKEAVPFVSPKSMEVTLTLPYYGKLAGMGIKKGVTLIVGGGYHGKSTLLKALELGVYNHIAGDGREYVITDASAVKLRAEDGRSVQKADISMFIRNLPNKKDTAAFYTEDASGSTSQAANTVEAMEAGAKLFLIDEDTSATNFMIRDELMQRVVNRENEPITPFIDRIEALYDTYGISTVLVAGSSGSYFHKADCVIQMNRYEPVEITQMAKEEAQRFPLPVLAPPELKKPKLGRVVRPERRFREDARLKMKTMGKDGILVGHDTIDVRYLEQLTDTEQLNALGYLLKYAECHIFDGRKSLTEAVDQLEKMMEKDGIGAVCGGSCPSGNLAAPRRQEIFACFNRYRKLSVL